MELDKTLSEVAARFVKKAFRDRFEYEAKKKPIKLMARIWGEPSSVFSEQYRLHANVSLQTFEGACYRFQSDGFHLSSWKEFMDDVEHLGGGGYFAIDVTGRAFFAQSDGFPPRETYAGYS